MYIISKIGTKMKLFDNINKNFECFYVVGTNPIFVQKIPLKILKRFQF